MTNTTRTIIVGATAHAARQWCRENGVQPYARGTVIIASEGACRGLTITDEDVLVDLGGPLDDALVEGLNLALLNSSRTAPCRPAPGPDDPR